MTGAPVRAILKLDQLYLHLLSVLYSTCIRIRAHFRSYLNPAAVPMTPLDMLAMPSPTFGVFGCWQIGNLLDQHAPQQSASGSSISTVYTVLILPIELLPGRALPRRPRSERK